MDYPQIDLNKFANASESKRFAVLVSYVNELLRRSENASVGSSESKILSRPEAIKQYPGFTDKSVLAVLNKHCAILGGPPTDDQLREQYERIGTFPVHQNAVSKRLICTSKQAQAWMYLLRKKGWVVYDEVTFTYSQAKDVE